MGHKEVANVFSSFYLPEKSIIHCKCVLCFYSFKRPECTESVIVQNLWKKKLCQLSITVNLKLSSTCLKAKLQIKPQNWKKKKKTQHTKSSSYKWITDCIVQIYVIIIIIRTWRQLDGRNFHELKLRRHWCKYSGVLEFLKTLLILFINIFITGDQRFFLPFACNPYLCKSICVPLTTETQLFIPFYETSLLCIILTKKDTKGNIFSFSFYLCFYMYLFEIICCSSLRPVLLNIINEVLLATLNC